MKRWPLFLALAAVALILGGLLSLLFRDWVRTQVAYPLVYLFWILKLLILSIPQDVFWGVLVFVAIVAALYVSWPESLPQREQVTVRLNKSASRYSTWLRYMKSIDTSRFTNDNLARDLVRLSVQILAEQQHLTTDEVYHQLDHNQISLPPEFLDFLHRRAFQYEIRHESRLVEFFTSIFRPRQTHRPPGVYSTAELEASQIIAYIEGLFRQPDQAIEDNSIVEENR